MQRIVINACYGGFSLSREGVRRYAELKGRECYIFGSNIGKKIGKKMPYGPDDGVGMFWSAFDIPNPNEVIPTHEDDREGHREAYERHHIDSRPADRTDHDLISVVEELGEAASGGCAELRIVEVPNDARWEIEEYDGTEWVAESHRTWGA